MNLGSAGFAVVLDMEVADESSERIAVSLGRGDDRVHQGSDKSQVSDIYKEHLGAHSDRDRRSRPSHSSRETVILFEGAKLKFQPSEPNVVTTGTQTLITANVTGKRAVLMQRAVEKVDITCLGQSRASHIIFDHGAPVLRIIIRLMTTKTFQARAQPFASRRGPKAPKIELTK